MWKTAPRTALSTNASSDDAAKPVYQRAAAKLQYVANERLDALRCFGTLWWFVFTCAPSSRLAGCYTRWAVTETSSGRTACWNAGQALHAPTGASNRLSGRSTSGAFVYCQWKRSSVAGEKRPRSVALSRTGMRSVDFKANSRWNAVVHSLCVWQNVASSTWTCCCIQTRARKILDKFVDVKFLTWSVPH